MGKKSDLESVHLVNHSKCMMAAFQNFRQDETMLDVTLACNGQSMKAHKLLLSACSPFFKELFAENPCTHPIIILRDFEFAELKAVIEFIYKGELSVPRERLMSTLKVAEELNVRGLRRSEPSAKKYEKLYNQIYGKLSSKKKRKRRRHDSSDSEVKECISSDPDILSDNEKTVPESRFMEVENNSTNESRPVVLRVVEPSASNEESSSKDVPIEEDNPIPLSVDLIQESMTTADISISELDIETENASQDIEVVCSENSTSLQDTISTNVQNAFQVGGDVYIEEQVINLTEDYELSSETQYQEDGKSFVCSKCDSVFTSRIDLMRHGTNGECGTDLHKCQHCPFSSPDIPSLQKHQLVHLQNLPYKCNKCSEEFSSEEFYQVHLLEHEKETVSKSESDMLTGTNREIVLYRCSVCFARFTSRLNCQLHEKTCQREC